MEEVELQGRQSDQASLLRPNLVDAALDPRLYDISTASCDSAQECSLSLNPNMSRFVCHFAS